MTDGVQCKATRCQVFARSTSVGRSKLGYRHCGDDLVDQPLTHVVVGVTRIETSRHKYHKTLILFENPL
jgi:hypothetical protein